MGSESHSVVANFLWPHGLQCARLPCPSPTPGACSNSCPSSWWCRSTISILCHPLLFLLSIFPSTRVFSNKSILHIRWPNYWSFSFRSVFPMTIQDWFPLGWTGLISLQSKGLSRVFSNNSKTSILQCSAFFMIHLSHPYMTTGKTVALTIWTYVSKVISMLFNMLSRFVIAFLPRSSHLLTSWLQSPYAVILEPKKIKSHCFYCFPIYLPWNGGTWCHDLCLSNVEF